MTAPATRPTGFAARLRDLDDHVLSPHTGWTRAHWEALADHLLLSARRWASPAHAGIALPGETGGYGARIDALEGFARTFLTAAFRVAGSRGQDPHGFLERYAEGLAAGTDPESAEAWPRLHEHGQAKVEAASVALGLHLTRPWLWERLDPAVQERVVDYLSDGLDTFYPPINWLWFRVVVREFLHSVGALDDLSGVREEVATLDGFYRGDGWYADGDERSYDHYVGWAMHLYPVLWARMAAGRAEADAAAATAHERLELFLPDALGLVGGDGGPLVQGRSLTYRFAAAAPFWVGAMADAGSPGLLRRAASGVVKHFVERGAPDDDGLLTLGWYGSWRPLAQRYSGPGSPYWASKGLLGLVLPPEHPAWTAVEEPLPVEVRDTSFVVGQAGWQVSGTRADGLVRVLNHGTDHSRPGSGLSDGPLYSRLGYSTATWPVVAGDLRHRPLDQSVVLLDGAGEPSHRTGFEDGHVSLLDGGTSVGSSRWRSHWVEPDPSAPDHGSGYPDASGSPRLGPWLEAVSLLRGAWEVRLVRVAPGLGDDVVPAGLRVGGWPVTGDVVDAAAGDGAAHAVVAPAPLVEPASPVEPVETPLASVLRTADGRGAFARAGVEQLVGVTPLAGTTCVPWLATDGAPEPGRWYAAAVALAGEAPADAPEVTFPVPGVARAAWADGAVDEVVVDGR
ncbi:DUF2264 domain-containing protein [Krasilnikoviella flava]|uniref:DUF2264 domain-containing protein n=1 Tax=Krasilnikoviella flava TaxID=526729 RepID=A0A1T5LXM5_9MICO|nr:DUF2264 domain-containing protein [Krasilnikoviella flava]SKC80721.1 hypothetical protein SAMN04324258_4066 [Krasilnikoviella flava]